MNRVQVELVDLAKLPQTRRRVEHVPLNVAWRGEMGGHTARFGEDGSGTFSDAATTILHTPSIICCAMMRAALMARGVPSGIASGSGNAQWTSSESHIGLSGPLGSNSTSTQAHSDGKLSASGATHVKSVCDISLMRRAQTA